MRYILAFDLGTTGNRVFCYDERGRVLSSTYAEFSQYYPRPGWVEHDPVEIYDAVVKLTHDAISAANLDPNKAIGIGITNQRETTVLWHRGSGKPVHRAIVWQCRRTHDYCTALRASHGDLIRKKTALVVDPYFSASKLRWLLDNHPEVGPDAAQGDVLFGTIDSWILWKLTGGKAHATDYTNASRTMLFNITEKTWDDELIELFGVSARMLPKVRSSAGLFGVTRDFAPLPDGVPIFGIAGDQQAALAGQNCVHPGSIKNTYGTGCFLLQHTGTELKFSRNGLISTIVCDTHGEPAYGIEGSVFIGGAVVQWMRDSLHFYEKSEDTAAIARSATPGDLVFIPAFSGLGAPYWKSEARGALFGITRDTSIAQIVRAALKGIAHRSNEVIHAMEEDSGRKIPELRADGGASGNEYLMQFQADITGIPVLIPENAETTALGAAYLAGIGAGLYKSIDEIASMNTIAKRYKPSLPGPGREAELARWRSAIRRLTL